LGFWALQMRFNSAFNVLSSKLFFLCIICIDCVLFYAFLMCKCVLYYCRRD
jgi:hypothetical protein